MGVAAMRVYNGQKMGDHLRVIVAECEANGPCRMHQYAVTKSIDMIRKTHAPKCD